MMNRIAVLLVLVFGLNACELDPIADPNGPTAESFETGAALSDLQLLVSGLEAVIRNDMEFHYETVNIVGREYYDLNNVDPRYTGELLGAQGAILDNNGFLTTRSFSARHRSIRNGHVLINAANNADISNAQRNGYLGMAKTVQAYEMLLELNRQYENGIRLDTSDPFNLGPYSNGYQDGLSGIMSILNDANSNLANAEFAFVSTLADSPAEFAQFNRALAARVALYQNDNATALTALDDSFMNLTGDMFDGIYHSFGLSGNDQANPLFYIPTPDNDRYIVQQEFFDDAEAGDSRVSSKTLDLGTTIIADDLQGDFQITLYNSNIDGVPLIRNEELILIYAEANIASNPGEAVNAINIVRNAASLGNYTGSNDPADLENEILQQRRYSLFGEGHRWIDMRRYGRLDQIPTDRPGDVVHVQFPRPIAEQ